MHLGKILFLANFSSENAEFCRCGHCTKFKPTYTKLAQHYAKQSNLILAQIDAAANDIPEGFNVTGYPTIYFVPTSNKPVKYEGDREFNDLTDFIDNFIQSKREL